MSVNDDDRRAVKQSSRFHFHFSNICFSLRFSDSLLLNRCFVGSTIVGTSFSNPKMFQVRFSNKYVNWKLIFLFPFISDQRFDHPSVHPTTHPSDHPSDPPSTYPTSIIHPSYIVLHKIIDPPSSYFYLFNNSFLFLYRISFHLFSSLLSPAISFLSAVCFRCLYNLFPFPCVLT
jgi:hypothetical protein